MIRSRRRLQEGNCMPRTRSMAWSELKIGMLSVAALVIAAVLIFTLGGQGGFFGSGTT